MVSFTFPPVNPFCSHAGVPSTFNTGGIPWQPHHHVYLYVGSRRPPRPAHPIGELRLPSGHGDRRTGAGSHRRSHAQVRNWQCAYLARRQDKGKDPHSA